MSRDDRGEAPGPDLPQEEVPAQALDGVQVVARENTRLAVLFQRLTALHTAHGQKLVNDLEFQRMWNETKSQVRTEFGLANLQ